MSFEREITPRTFLDRRDEINRQLNATRQIELRAVLYAYAEESFIASATTGFSEAGMPVKLPFTAPDGDVGRTVRDLLLQTYMHSAPTHTEAKLTDWAVFKASGAKTGRTFEEQSVYVTVETAGTGFSLRAQRRKPLSSVYVGEGLSLAVDVDELGKSVRKLVSIVRLLDSQDAL